LPALIIFRHSGKLTCRHGYQDSPLPKTSNWVEKFTKFGQLILSKIIKIAVGNLRASPPQLFGRGGDHPHGVGAYDQKSLGVGAKVLGTFVHGSESSRERKFHTMVLSLPGAKVLRSESSIIPRDTSAPVPKCLKTLRQDTSAPETRFKTLGHWCRSVLRHFGTRINKLRI